MAIQKVFGPEYGIYTVYWSHEVGGRGWVHLVAKDVPQALREWAAYLPALRKGDRAKGKFTVISCSRKLPDLRAPIVVPT